ncbi:hypothetical protein MN0502_13990 [Arthrobacter sp. MN05-02]|nr:hypothetical protein MN0502_13990 [Arthrobacter sp. MN05-02]
MIILRFSGKDLGREPADPVLAGGRGEVFEQDGADPASLVGVRDVEGDLGLERIVEAVIAADADDVRATRDHEGHAVAVVHLREALELLRAELGLVREEAEVDRILRLAHVEGLHRVRVEGRDGPQVRRPAVAQDDISLPIFRVLSVRHHRLRVVGIPSTVGPTTAGTARGPRTPADHQSAHPSC